MWKIAIGRRGVLGIALGAALLSAAPISLRWSSAAAPSLSFDRAQARIGHPLSPGSIAGVHRRVYRRTARRAYYGGAVAAAGAAGAYYGVAGSNYGDESGYSPYSSGGYNNLYNYSPAATTTAPAVEAAPAANTAATNEGGSGSNEQSSNTLPSDSPELYAACLNRTYGACPEQ
jgi:hypothetical protein